MAPLRLRTTHLLLALGAALGVLLAAPSLGSLWREETPVARGARLARESGCLGCHALGAERGYPNPGARGGEAPAFAEGSLTPFAGLDQELADFIRYGVPAELRGSPDVEATRRAALLQMPAYQGRLTEAEIADLVAYLKANSGLWAPTSGPAAAGYAVARANDCFGCHGPLGEGGLANPGSLKGYVPALTGADYPELVRDDAELRAWLRTGTTPRLEANPLARLFLRRQVVKMPAFGDRLTARQLDDLVELIHWLRQRRLTPGTR